MRFERSSRSPGKCRIKGAAISSGRMPSGLRLDEAMHDLTIRRPGYMASPRWPQNGAPLGWCAVEVWLQEYQVHRQDRAGRDHAGFRCGWQRPGRVWLLRNVNPDVPHPALVASQRAAARHETGARKTLLFKRLRGQVASLLPGDGLAQVFLEKRAVPSPNIADRESLREGILCVNHIIGETRDPGLPC